ncbi:MAG: hypothetical protein M3R07_01335, partial [Gemmatimonadota bacterium]|nr:hypothetical protein [Gemmatimonadota bacterium]
EFDGSQLTVRTDAAEVRAYLLEAFAHMLVPEVTRNIGELHILRSGAGYAMAGDQTLDFSGVSASDLLPLLKDEVRLRFMRSRPDLLWLHAGAVERGGSALLISGPSGHGKSTITTLLCERGWRLLSDDIAPVRMDADEVIPFPQSPLRRVHPGREIRPDAVNTLTKQSVAIGESMVRRSAAPIKALVFVAYGSAEGLVTIPRGSAAMEILKNSTNFIDHKGAAVGRAAEIARRVPAYRLSYMAPAEAAGAVDALW